MTGKRNEKLVFKSDWHRIYQWRQKLYDGSYDIFERIERRSIVIMIPVAGNEIIMAFEKQPMFERCLGLLGGTIEEGESPLAAAKRELMEEAGMVSRNWGLIKKYKYTGRITYTIYMYAARDSRKVAEQNLDPGEKIKVIRVTFARFLASIERMRLDDRVKLDLLKARYEPRMRRHLKRTLGLPR